MENSQRTPGSLPDVARATELNPTWRMADAVTMVRALSIEAGRPSRTYWLCQLGGWGLYATVFFVVLVAVAHIPWARAAGDLTLLVGLGLLLTHLWHGAVRARGWSRLSFGGRLLRVVAGSLVLALPAAACTGYTTLSVWESPAGSGYGLRFLVHWANWTALLLCWNGCYFAALSIRQRKSAQLRESELARALQLSELRLLKSQLNPHFLFNALNTVRALIADDPARAQKAVTQLAGTLRYTLGSGEDELVTLEQELAIVADYLDLESLRFGTRLRLERAIDARALRVRIPVMLLQTLVENAIKHGIAELPGGGVLRIHAACEQALFVLEVENPRPGSIGPVVPEGIGLRNAAERLRLIFGPGAELELNLTQPLRAVARVQIPMAS